MKTLKVTLTGTSPLLMHADTLANPLHPLTKAHKEMTSRRKRTDEDLIAIAKSEFVTSCYWNKDTGFYIPGQNLDACLINAAKLQRLGVKFKQGVQVLENELVIKEDMPATPEDLWASGEYTDARGVRVGTAKIIRYRPIIRKWSVDATIMYNPTVVNDNDIRKALEDSGLLIGLCDYRPRFGKFEATVH